eukprot:TRINITY_DN48805_c0_g1_i1.p1 TRINITY_DN48805_c0_g1~~TRINITY_DN48805_c0_g1_i1.p1  ORF type:complete len:593 (+),score=175.03 TRINITY_DN48805_c0_g1_i1:13-1791(+)
MPKKGAAASSASATATAPGSAEASSKEKTFSAASGKHFVLAQESYPQELPTTDLRCEIVAATDGDLLELLAMKNGWGYGRRFKERQGAVNEGVFQLEWVHGVKLVMEGGQRRPVEIDVQSPEYGFKLSRGSDAASKLRLKRYHKKIDDVQSSWSHACEATKPAASKAAAEASAKAAKSAAALEKEDAEQKSRAQKQREARAKAAAAKRAAAAAASAPADDEAHQHAQPEEEEEAASRNSELSSSGVEDLATFVGSRSKVLQGKTKRVSAKQVSMPTTGDAAWQAHWEQQAAHLEGILSASSSGVEESEGRRCSRPSLQKKIMTRKFAKSLLEAKRSGELHVLAEEWERAHCEMVSRISDLNALNEQVTKSLLDGASGVGHLERIAEEMASEAERKAAEVRSLKERVFRAMRDMRRSQEVIESEDEAGLEPASAEASPHAKHLLKRAWQGLLDSKKSRELERIADEMAEQLQSKAESIKDKIRQGLLRAHRAGELQELRHEFDELVDEVSLPATAAASTEVPPHTPRKKRWSEYSSGSDAESLMKLWCPGASESPAEGFDPPPRSLADLQRSSASPEAAAEADVSGSEGANRP